MGAWAEYVDRRSKCTFCTVGSYPFPKRSTGFLPVSSTSLLKTLFDKEKMFVTSNFSCSHTVFPALI